MTMRRNLRSTVLTAATVLVLAVTARAEREIEFVDGIIAKGYYKLAVEHLKKIAADADLPQKEKVLIPLKRGLAYRRMAAVEREPKLKEQYLTEASKALDEFAGRHPSHPQILNVSLEKVEIESDRARALQRRLADEKTPEDKAKLFKQIEQAYQKAIAAARTIVTEAGKKADVYRPRMHTPADKDKFWVYFGAEVRGMFQIGNVEYLWAQLYPEDPKDKTSAERRKHLEASAAQFKLTQKKRPRNNITMEAHVRRGICLRELAPFQKDAKERPKMLKEAMKEFQAALGVQRTPQTKPTRAEAYYQKAVTSYQIKEYEAAVSAVDGFTSENPDGVDSYRGQQALLLKARALGDLADEVRKRPRPAEGAVDWRDTYVQATRTVKDISPKYRQIREEADKLIQDWTKRFPAEDAVIVISPILAAARAKGAFEQGQLPQAIELYREVIALSEGKTQFVQFETEAWQNLGSCYYNQRRLYEADVAWSELLKRFPDVNGGEQIAYVIQAMYAYQHNQTNDDFDLGRFLESARVFVSRYPRDSRVFEVLTESANGYTIRGERIKAADIWGQARPENARYAESMFNSGDLYRQEFLKLVDAGRGGTPEAKQYVTKAEERLRLAADAKPPVAKTGEDYRGLALAGLAEMLADRKLPQPDSARKVPALVDEFKKRFAGETAVLPRVLLAGVGAHVVLKQPQEADKLATEIVEKHPLTEAFLPAVQLMILAWQDTSAEKANAWRTQQVDAAGDLSKARSITLL